MQEKQNGNALLLPDYLLAKAVALIANCSPLARSQKRRRAKINLYKCRKCNKNNVPHALRTSKKRHLHICQFLYGMTKALGKILSYFLMYARFGENNHLARQERERAMLEVFSNFSTSALSPSRKTFVSLKSAHQHRNVNSLAARLQCSFYFFFLHF